MSEPTITVYTTPNCVQCKGTKRHLDRIGADYNTVDLSQDAQALDAVKALGYTRAPVVAVRVPGADSDLHWAGYRPDLLDEYCKPKENA